MTSEQSSGQDPNEVTHEEPWPRRVLVVDDEASIGDIATQVLGPHGLAVELARSGEQALATLEAHPEAYLWVLLDLGLPGIPGAKVLETIKARWGWMHVILCTGDTTRLPPGKPGDYGVLPKPFQLNELRAAFGLKPPPAPPDLPDPEPAAAAAAAGGETHP